MSDNELHFIIGPRLAEARYQQFQEHQNLKTHYRDSRSHHIAAAVIKSSSPEAGMFPFQKLCTSMGFLSEIANFNLELT